MTVTLRTLALPGFALAWVLAPAAGRAASCPATLASLSGSYGMLVSGATQGANAGPKYLAGALVFSGTGSVSAANVYSGAGVDSAATGTYVINSADCTVTLTLTVGSTTPQVYTLAIKQTGEAVGIEVDAIGIATIDLQPQAAAAATTANFTNTSLNGTFAANCIGPSSQQSDLNLVTFSNGTLAGTDPYNNDGATQASNDPYTGTYTINADGTFSGSLTVAGTPFDYYGVISNAGAKVEYIYSGVSNGVATAAFASCTGKLAAPISAAVLTSTAVATAATATPPP
jgi:hypothetical protein